MSLSRTRLTILAAFAVAALLGAVAVIQRDTIADLILRGGDTSLTGDAAQGSPQAALAIEFLAALRAMDESALARFSTAEVMTKVREIAGQPGGDAGKMRAMMLEDLPAEPAALRRTIKSVQTHKDRAAVLAETRANSWYVQLVRVEGAWKVSGF